MLAVQHRDPLRGVGFESREGFEQGPRHRPIHRVALFRAAHRMVRPGRRPRFGRWGVRTCRTSGGNPSPALAGDGGPIGPDEGLRPPRLTPDGPHPNPCMRSFLSRGKLRGVWPREARRGPLEARFCPWKPWGAQCRWPNACQGRSRRRRWPKASLYKGLASDDDRRPRSVGRDYAHLSRDLSPLPRA